MSATKYATVRIPAPSSMLLANLLGIFGLLGFAVAVGGLTHNAWWSLAVVAAEAVVLSVVATMNLAADDEPVASDDELATVRPRAA